VLLCQLLNPLERGQHIFSRSPEYEIEGVAVRVYIPAKTVADCFKYRNKRGVDFQLILTRQLIIPELN
jgi:hypothetical protein